MILIFTMRNTRCDRNLFDEGRLRRLSTILKPKGTQASLELLIAVTILLIPSVLFSRVTVNVLVRCIFHVYKVR